MENKSYKILFICASNKDRSPNLEKYFRNVHSEHEYKSCGVNKYFTSQHGTTYIAKELLDWADIWVFAENVHFNRTLALFSDEIYADYTGLKVGITWNKKRLQPYLILNCGEYSENTMEDYITKSEIKVFDYINWLER